MRLSLRWRLGVSKRLCCGGCAPPEPAATERVFVQEQAGICWLKDALSNAAVICYTPDCRHSWGSFPECKWNWDVCIKYRTLYALRGLEIAWHCLCAHIAWRDFSKPNIHMCWSIFVPYWRNYLITSYLSKAQKLISDCIVPWLPLQDKIAVKYQKYDE